MVAVDFVNYMIGYCLSEENKQKEDIEEALEDILDQEFETICEDNSPKEIAEILDKFLTLLKEGNIAQCEAEYNNLPTSQEGWLINSKPQPHLTVPVPDTSSESENEDNGGAAAGTSNDVEMTENSGWTHVKSRRKR